MTSIKIDELQINPRIAIAAKRAGLHDSRSVLSLSAAELERLTGLTAVSITHLKDAISECVLKHQAVTGLQMWKQECHGQVSSPKLSTGCDEVDTALRGGVLLKGITEIAGESAAGKSQLCLQLCLTVQLPSTHGGLAGGALYICTEGAFPNRRLHQMAQHFSQLYGSVLKHHVMDHIFVEHVADFDALNNCLQKKVPLVLAQGNVRLIVLDSIAALFRCHYDSQSLVTRAKHLASLAKHLRQLSDQYNCVVICVNQVSANMSEMSDSYVKRHQNIPALGPVWADHVTCRLLMSRLGDAASHSTSMQGRISQRRDLKDTNEIVSNRFLEVVFAPHLAQQVVPLVIHNGGIRDGWSDKYDISVQN